MRNDGQQDQRDGPQISVRTRDFLGRHHRLLIDGRFVASLAGATSETIDPATGRVLARFDLGDERDIDSAVGAARRAFETVWSRQGAAVRAGLMGRLADLIDRDAEFLAELEVLDNGMPLHLARFLVADAAKLIRYYAGWPSRIEGRTMPAAPGVAFGSETLTYTLREPVGVAGQIIPWNVPLSMACLKLAPALAAGCTIVMKPAEETPLSALALGDLILEAGFPAGVVNIVNGLGEVAGAALAGHPDVDKIAFTGSTDIGRHIVRAAAGNLKKVSLELGGKSPVVIFPDADLARAIPGAAQAAFFLQGQNCMAGTRIFVHEAIHDRVVTGIAEIASGLKIGPGLDPGIEIGPLISTGHRDRVLALVRSGLDEGARLITGGGALTGPGWFVQPTVFADARPGMRIMREEIFGPVMAIQRFAGDDLDGIAALANDTCYGLSGSVWTRDLATAHAMVRRIRAGHVSINCHGAVDSMIPFGGYKQSGWGREFGAEGLDAYLETKAVTARL